MDAPAEDQTDEASHSPIVASAISDTRRFDIGSNEEHATGSSRPSGVTDAPPFWSWRDRTVSQVSYQSLDRTAAGRIQLEDHSEETNVQTQGCWARSVTIDDHTIISGPSGIGAYVVWNCTVDTLKGGAMSIRKRYSEFDLLRTNLVKAFPHAEASIPVLPRKSVVSRFRPKFLEQRRNGLNHFMNCVLLNPEFAASPILKDFIFA